MSNAGTEKFNLFDGITDEETSPSSDEETKKFDLEDEFEEDESEDESQEEESYDFDSGEDDSDDDWFEDEDDEDEDDEDDDSEPKPDPNAALLQGQNEILSKLVEGQNTLAQNLNKPKDEPKPDPKADRESLLKDLTAKVTFAVPPAYIEALTGEDPAKAAQAMQTLLETQTKRTLEALVDHMSGTMDKRLESFGADLNGKMTAQTQAQQTQIQIEQDFTSNYPEFAAFKSNPDTAQFLALAVQKTQTDPSLATIKTPKEYSTLLAKHLSGILRPMFKTAGIKMTKANVLKMTQTKKSKRKSPPRTNRSSAGKRSSRRSGDSEVTRFNDDFFENL